LSVKRKDRLRKKIERFPKKPGIYFFKDKDQNVIYIGKARSLKDRVKSYLSPSPDSKVTNIQTETEDIDYILTDSEKEASFLENNFIQHYQPRFNLRLKDDKSFPYLKVSLQERFPGIYLTRKVESDGSKYFGPFSPANQARKTIHLVSKYFGIRTCQEKIPGTRKRPCLEYDLKLCSAPCTEYINEKDYQENTAHALLFLEGNVDRLEKISKKKMDEAAKNQEFEQAARWRDLIHTLSHIKEKPKLISVRLENMDIVGFYQKNEYSAFYVFLMRKGKVKEYEKLLYLEKKETPKENVLLKHLKEFYQDREDWPDKILLPFPPSSQKKWEQEINQRAKKNIQLLVPQKGKNRKLVDLAGRNAEIVLRKKVEEQSPLKEAERVLGLKTYPHHIEGFDISNIGGQESVGSLVVFEEGIPRKQDYRKYKIKTVKGPDDVASIREVLRRRYSRLIQDEQILPDLVLVDGGKGQLNAAKKTLDDLGLSNIPVVSLAKKEEVIFTPSQKQGIKLERTSPVLKLLQHIRDESHRFALSYHRLRRKKKSFESELDGIPGLGRKRKSRLLAAYKSLQEIKKTPAEDLAKIIGSKPTHELLKVLK
jgi:excinuclease ABC subunit C